MWDVFLLGGGAVVVYAIYRFLRPVLDARARAANSDDPGSLDGPSSPDGPPSATDKPPRPAWFWLVMIPVGIALPFLLLIAVWLVAVSF